MDEAVEDGVGEGGLVDDLVPGVDGDRELRISCVYGINLDIPFSLHLSLRPTSTNG